MNLPNKLTLLRMAMVPVYVALMLLDFPGHALIALAVFILASLTDLLDGHIARSRNLITNFGKFMDPLADKVLVTASMVCFCAAGAMPAWAVIVVLFREFAVSGMRLVAVEGGRVIAAGWSGKVKTAATMVCLCVMHLPIPAPVNWLCVGIIVVTTLYSGVEYFVKNRDVFRGSM